MSEGFDERITATGSTYCYFVKSLLLSLNFLPDCLSCLLRHKNVDTKELLAKPGAHASVQRYDPFNKFACTCFVQDFDGGRGRRRVGVRFDGQGYGCNARA